MCHKIENAANSRKEKSFSHIVIDALDEAVIHDVKKYAIVEPGDEESGYIKAKKDQGFNSMR